MASFKTPRNFQLYDEIDNTKQAVFSAADITTGYTRKFAFPDSDGVLVTQSTLFNLIYPVGAIYMSVVSTSPATLFGGTWAALAAGRVLVGIDAGDADFDVVEETGGAKTHTHSYTDVVNHTHPVNVTDPGHVHDEMGPTGASGGAVTIASDTNAIGSADSTLDTGSATTGITATTSNPASGVASGTTVAGSGLQPYLVVYMWKRTA